MASEIDAIRAALRASPEMHDRLREMALSGKLGPMEEVPDDAPLTVVAGYDHCGIDGSQQRRCECAAVIWVSPSTQAMLIQRGANPTRVICAGCAMAELKQQQKEARAQTRTQ